jgi:precorrin-2 dehydrogenase/sirohydrochlorin ferrochelatase
MVLNLKGKRAVVFGGGRVAERRVLKLLGGGSKIKAVGKEFTEKLKGMEGKDLELVKAELDEEKIRGFVGEGDLIFVATNDKGLNDAIEEEAKRQGKLVNRADKVGDFIVPASVEIGDVLIAISTKGKSPMVAKALKRRIKRVITQEDIMLVELQEFARGILKDKIRNQGRRREVLREIVNMPKVVGCLKSGDLERAKGAVLEYLEES